MRRGILIAILAAMLLLTGCAKATWQPLWSTPMPGYTPGATLQGSAVPQASSLPLLDYFQKDADSMSSPHILIQKSKRVLELYDGDTLMARMKIALGNNPEGPKTKDGDGKTPEGTYYICATNGASKYDKSLCISYPNEDDALRGLGLGFLNQSEYDSIVNAIEDKKQPNWNTKMGGEIAINGQGEEGKDKTGDWTAGNIAVTDEQMDYIWKYIKKGAEVVIQP